LLLALQRRLQWLWRLLLLLQRLVNRQIVAARRILTFLVR